MPEQKNALIREVRSSIDKRTFVKIKLSKYKGGDPDFREAFVTLQRIKSEEMLSFKFSYKTRDEVKNFEIEKGIRLIEGVTGKDFFSVTLFTAEKDISIDYSKKGKPVLHTRKPVNTSYEIPKHNREKSRFINSEAEYFNLLGITSKGGKVKSGMYDKFRQVDKFIEIVDSLYRSSDLQEKEEIRIMDMGSGKSYMTFALYDFFENTLGKKALVFGIEQRKELVEMSRRIARQCEFRNLEFENAAIGSMNKSGVDITVALHACDTATDDAIVKAVESGSSVIILAPCCHKYLRKKIVIPESMNKIFRHGILEERLSVSLTDGLRALTLEYLGYETKVFEFISHEHTAKNTMITAVKKTASLRHSKLEEIEAVKKEFGIDDYYLDLRLGAYSKLQTL